MRNVRRNSRGNNKSTGHKNRPGARRVSVSWRDRLDSWLAHHKESSRGALQRLWRQPISTLMTLLVLGLALALPASLSIVVQNIHQVTGDWEGSPRVSVFLHMDTSETAQRSLAKKWQAQEHVERVDVVTPDDALADFKALGGSQEVLAALPDNPLPPVLVVYPATSQESVLQRLEKNLQAAPEVEKVVFDMAWIRKLNAFIDIAERLVMILTLAFGAGIILLINNTLQLAIDSRREEIVVMKTVGGTDGFVRRPFLYTGFWYGIGGGVLALIMVMVAFGFVGAPAQELLELYGNKEGLIGMPVSTFLMLPLLAGLLGLLGAFIAVNRHIHDIDPRQF